MESVSRSDPLESNATHARSRSLSRNSSLSSTRNYYGISETGSDHGETAERPIILNNRAGKTASTFLQTSRQPAFVLKPSQIEGIKRNGPLITREEGEENIYSSARDSRAGIATPVEESRLPFSSRNSLPLVGHDQYASSTMTILNSIGGGESLNVKSSYDPLLYQNPTRERQDTEETKLSTKPVTRQPVPVVNPFVPVLDTKGKKVKNYKLHAGKNRFYLGGMLITSLDNPITFLIVVTLSILLPTLFYLASGPFLWFDSTLGAGGKAVLIILGWLVAMMWTNMLRTAFRDPGILPRGLDLISERKWIDGGDGGGAWKSEPKYLRIKDGVVISKWCETCETYRSPRASHCRLCNNCVDITDHHCTFLNNCIGKRNYLSFYTFLITSIVSSALVISLSSYHLYYAHSHPSGSEDFLSSYQTIIALIVIIFSFLLMVPILGLFLYHTYLIASNRTTIEMLRPKPDRSTAIDPNTGEVLAGNVFSQSTGQNFLSLLCRPAIPSYISPEKYSMVDARNAKGEQLV